MTMPAPSPVSDDLQFLSSQTFGLILCLEAPAYRLSFVQEHVAALPVFADRQVYCLDGANRFDPYPFANLARRAGLRIEEVFGRVRVSRAFTIHQLQSAAERLLPPLREVSPTPLVMVLGVEHLFLEESLPLWERQHVLASVLRTLSALGGDGLPIVVTHEPALGRDAWWLPMMREAADRAAVLEGRADEERPTLTWLK